MRGSPPSPHVTPTHRRNPPSLAVRSLFSLPPRLEELQRAYSAFSPKNGVIYIGGCGDVGLESRSSLIGWYSRNHIRFQEIARLNAPTISASYLSPSPLVDKVIKI